MTDSNMFWAFILLCLSVGPPYCLHMRVKFYSSEPNNLHEELTRWIAKSLFFSLSEWILQLLRACFYRSVQCFVSVLYAMKLPKFFTFHFHTSLFIFLSDIYLCYSWSKTSSVGSEYLLHRNCFLSHTQKVFYKMLHSKMLYLLGNGRFLEGWIVFNPPALYFQAL